MKQNYKKHLPWMILVAFVLMTTIVVSLILNLPKQSKSSGSEETESYEEVESYEETKDNAETDVFPKKGIQLNYSFVDDAIDLDVKWGLINLTTAMMSKQPTKYSIEYGGNVYYFDEDTVELYDRLLKTFTDAGVRVVATVLNEWNSEFPELYYPNTAGSSQSMYFAFNTETKAGLNSTRAFAEFLVDRYTNGENGLVYGWLVGNEVNDNLQYHYMAPCDMETYVNAYYKEFETFYDVIKKYDENAPVYIPLEHRWQTANTQTDYGGRFFLEYFHKLELENKNEMDWGVAWHPYPYPLGDPDTLDDGDYPTTDTDGQPSYGDEVTLDYTTPIVSMKNIDILTDYFKENLLTKDGKVRDIILSEVGYTSYSVVVGENEAKQAANIAYAYYKTESNPYIQALIIRSHCDENEGSPYFKFGLRNGIDNPTKKMAYDVYKTVGTEAGYKYDRELLSILGADDWNEIIPGCERSVNDAPGGIDDITEGKDIADCTIQPLETQQYTGRPILPALTIYDGDKLLEEKVDYYTSYTSNAEVGTGRVTIVGTGEYSGFSEIYFCIAGKYAAVLDPAWYFENNESAKEACEGDLSKAEDYFVENDMARGVQGSEEFNVKYYINNYPELKEKYADNLKGAYEHYVTTGKDAGLVADKMLDTAVYEGIDYTYVYDYYYALKHNPEIWEACSNDPLNMLEYFVTHGMDEGMKASVGFDWEAYREYNGDLSEKFGDDIRQYYMHYLQDGYDEGRKACHAFIKDDSETYYKGTDYSAVFDAEYYLKNNPDVAEYIETHSGQKSKNEAALEHFVLRGMKEGRLGIATFDPKMYKALYSDLRSIYGDAIECYYYHYLGSGKSEGRYTSVEY